MIRILITSDHDVEREAERIGELLRSDFDILHLRKPSWNIDRCRRLLDEVDSQLYGRIVVHDHYPLCKEYGLRGVHLTGRHPNLPQGMRPKHISCSCHTLQEVILRKQEMTYLFLSPIFDSISKVGYKSPFPYSVLKEAEKNGIIDQQVIALGGVDYSKVALVQEMGFGGYAMLGNIWQ